MDIFISSLISGHGEIRDAVAHGITALGHNVIRAEEFGASPQSPQITCLEGVRRADTVILIIGADYGAVQASGMSATHEEYMEARDHCPVLTMVQSGVQRDERQSAFLEDVRGWSSGHYTENFSGPDDLRDSVTRALHQLELAQATGPVDGEEMLQRAIAFIPESGYRQDMDLTVSVSSGPNQQIFRPAQLEDGAFHRSLQKETTYGEWPVLDSKDGTEVGLDCGALILKQQRNLVRINEQGSISMTTRMDSHHLLVIVEEDVREVIHNRLSFASWFLNDVDSSHKLSHCAIAVGFSGGGMHAWRTCAEHAASPNNVTMSGFPTDEPIVANVSPAHRTRAALHQGTAELAEDLTVILRRHFQ